jgi:hypothetical protein
MARRLALGDRVIWMGTDAWQPNGCDTIIRITAHQVEVENPNLMDSVSDARHVRGLKTCATAARTTIRLRWNAAPSQDPADRSSDTSPVQ